MRRHQLTTLWFILSSLCLWRSVAQVITDVDMRGETSPYALLASKLKADYEDLPEQDAIDIAAVLHAAREDADTTWLLRSMKEGSGKDDFADFAKDASPTDIVKALREALDELKAVEVLFQNPERAVAALIEDGMVPADKVSLYKNDPALLEEDLRKNLYFMLISYAAAGGYL